MTTNTTNGLVRRFEITTSDPEQLSVALWFAFGDAVDYACWHTDGDKLCLVPFGYGNEFIPDGRWMHFDRMGSSQARIPNAVLTWYETGLAPEEQWRLLTSPYGRRNPFPLGFSASLVTRNSHEMLVIQPVW